MHGYYYFITNNFNGLVKYSKKIEEAFDKAVCKSRNYILTNYYIRIKLWFHYGFIIFSCILIWLFRID